MLEGKPRRRFFFRPGNGEKMESIDGSIDAEDEDLKFGLFLNFYFSRFFRFFNMNTAQEKNIYDTRR